MKMNPFLKQCQYFLMATRPQTLAVGICPILMGAYVVKTPLNFFLLSITLLCALCIQIGTNIANDYFDYKKGADTKERLGPVRVTQAGLISPSHMKNAIGVIFSMAALLGLYLCFKGGPVILIIGVVSIFCGIFYTAGPFAIGYLGLGDLFAFLFFGPVATMGTCFLQTQTWQLESLILGVSPGLFSAAVLAVNNLRDRKEDEKTGKKTLAVRLGSRAVKIEYTLCVFLGIWIPLLFAQSTIKTLIAFIALAFFAALLINEVWKKEGKELNPVLGKTGLLLLGTTLVLLCS